MDVPRSLDSILNPNFWLGFRNFRFFLCTTRVCLGGLRNETKRNESGRHTEERRTTDERLYIVLVVVLVVVVVVVVGLGYDTREVGIGGVFALDWIGLDSQPQKKRHRIVGVIDRSIG